MRFGACGLSRALTAPVASVALLVCPVAPCRAAGADRSGGYSVESASGPVPGFAVIADPSRPAARAPAGRVAARAVAQPVPRVADVASVRTVPVSDAAGPPLTLVFRCPAEARACPATVRALADVLRDAGIAVLPRPAPAVAAAHRGVSYVFEEDRAEALRIAGLVFGTETAERVPARSVRDPRPGLVQINLAG